MLQNKVRYSTKYLTYPEHIETPLPQAAQLGIHFKTFGTIEQNLPH